MAWSQHNSLINLSYREIKECTTIDGLNHIYKKYPSLQDTLYPIIVERKKQLEKQLIANPKDLHNGTYRTNPTNN